MTATAISSRPVLAHEPVSASNGMVVAQHPLAAEAGIEVLEKGGNAVDAAVTTAFAVGVTQPLMNGIGGGGVMIVHMADGSGGAVDYGMRAPGAATADMYELDGREDHGASSRRFSLGFSWPRVRDNANLDGHASIAVPGTLAGLATALAEWGTIDLADALAPAIELAEKGFPVGHHFTLALVAGRKLFARFPGTAPIYLPGGQPMSVGERFVQADHARTLKQIAAGGVDAFYRGEPAQRIADDVSANGGRLSTDDFARYRPDVHRADVHTRMVETVYRGVTVACVPGLNASPTLIEILNILQQFDLARYEYGSADVLHLVIEAVKLAAADRFTYLGDCAPRGGPIDALIDPDYAAGRYASVDLTRAGDVRAGDPWTATGMTLPDGFPAPAGIAPDRGTTTLTTADASGSVVALTQTNHGFSGVVTSGVGVMMNNGMGWFYPAPGTVNSITSYGRGLHNMTPVLLLEDGRLRAAMGSSGGRRIWTAILQSIVNHVDFGMALQDAVEAPRGHVETDDVLIDGRFSQEVRDELARRGHSLVTATPGYDSAPYSEPNGIEMRDGRYWSAVYPVCKPTVALGL